MEVFQSARGIQQLAPVDGVERLSGVLYAKLWQKEGFGIMAGHSTRMHVQLQNCRHKERLSILQAAKIDVVMARSYSDDADVCRGALSAPRDHFRPGQRDDVPHPTIVTVAPIM